MRLPPDVIRWLQQRALPTSTSMTSEPSAPPRAYGAGAQELARARQRLAEMSVFKWKGSRQQLDITEEQLSASLELGNSRILMWGRGHEASQLRS